MPSRFRKILVAAVFAVGMIVPTARPSFAAETHVEIDNVRATDQIEEYSRLNSKLKLTYSRDASQPGGATTASAIVTCRGRSPSTGGWVGGSYSGNCYNSYDNDPVSNPFIVKGSSALAYGKSYLQGLGYTNIRDVSLGSDYYRIDFSIPANPVGPDDVAITYSSKCTGSAVKSPLEKNYCVFNYDAEAGVTGETGDDMFRIEKEASAYLEYRKSDVDNRLNFYKRDLTSTYDERGIMLPSGPPTARAPFRITASSWPARRPKCRSRKAAIP